VFGAVNDAGAQTFEVGGQFGFIVGNTRLTITPEQITLRSRFPPRRSIVHRGRIVRLVRARLLPSWPAVTVILEEGGRIASASTGPSIIRTLRDSGFGVIEERRWISIGYFAGGNGGSNPVGGSSHMCSRFCLGRSPSAPASVITLPQT
jgi:hypothetical protein